jgi:hypothetical protein
MEDEAFILELTQKLRVVIGQHMLKFNEDKYREMVGSITIGLAHELAWFRHFVIAGNEVSKKTFDRVFEEKVSKYYEQFLRQV